MTIRYYQLADSSKVLYAAVALDPEMRLQYLESEWKERPEWIIQAREKAKGLWKEDYSNEKCIGEAEKEQEPNYAESSIISTGGIYHVLLYLSERILILIND